MFGRGNWAVYAIAPETLADFTGNLNNREVMLAVSQLAASAKTRWNEQGSSGINPFNEPRLDEITPLERELDAELASYLGLAQDARAEYPLTKAIYDSESYAYREDAFRIHGTLPIFGLWFVQNEWKDISDLASTKESVAYENYHRPYKFLASGPKKELDAAVRAKTAASRKQVPVLIDYVAGRLYIENTNKNFLFFVRDVLESLGVGFVEVAWKFGGDSNWPQNALKEIREESKYVADFQQAAADAATFNEEERKVIEDPELAKLVSDYFYTSETQSGLWASLSTPALIRLHKGTTPIVVKTPVQATDLLSVNDGTSIAGANITLQERIATTNRKTGVERVFRKDLISFDLNDKINLTEAGAALLNGFDMPAFKKGIFDEIKKSKQVPTIDGFWLNWLREMSNAIREIEATLRDVLGIENNEDGGIVKLFNENNNVVIEEG